MASDDSSTNYGFDRPEMFSLPLSNSVEFYQRHLFLCYKNPQQWPSVVETSDFPKLLSSALNARQHHLPLKTRLTMCAGCNGDKCMDGDLYTFPEMVRYRGVKESNVEAFVDEVLVNGKPWAGGEVDALAGNTYVFVCAHASRDKRCGHCGPVLIKKFAEEIGVRGLNEQVFVSTSSHIGGHKYAGNVIIFGTKPEGKVTGDWYGYVTPNDVPDLLDAHVVKGKIVQKLWRGQMGLKVEAVEKEENKASTVVNVQEKTEVKSGDTETKVKETATGCCQGSGSCGENQKK